MASKSSCASAVRSTVRLWEDIGFRTLTGGELPRDVPIHLGDQFRREGAHLAALGLGIADGNGGAERLMAHAIMLIEQAQRLAHDLAGVVVQAGIDLRAH